MHIRERSPGDLEHLRRLARRERNAEQKDRLMAAALAVERVQTADIQRALNRSRGFVQRWAYAYRDGGIEALKDKPRGGSVGKISGQNALRLMARIDAGPTAADKSLFQNTSPIDLIREQTSNAAASLWKAWKCSPQRS